MITHRIFVKFRKPVCEVKVMYSDIKIEVLLLLLSWGKADYGRNHLMVHMSGSQTV